MVAQILRPRPVLASLTVPVEGLDPADALFDALYEVAQHAEVRVVDNGVGLTSFLGWLRHDHDYSLELTGYGIPEQLVLTGLRDDDEASATCEAEADREAQRGRLELKAPVRVRAVLLERAGSVATYRVEGAS